MLGDREHRTRRAERVRRVRAEVPALREREALRVVVDGEIVDRHDRRTRARERHGVLGAVVEIGGDAPEGARNLHVIPDRLRPRRPERQVLDRDRHPVEGLRSVGENDVLETRRAPRGERAHELGRVGRGTAERPHDRADRNPHQALPEAGAASIGGGPLRAAKPSTSPRAIAGTTRAASPRSAYASALAASIAA